MTLTNAEGLQRKTCDDLWGLQYRDISTQEFGAHIRSHFVPHYRILDYSLEQDIEKELSLW